MHRSTASPSACLPPAQSPHIPPYLAPSSIQQFPSRRVTVRALRKAHNVARCAPTRSATEAQAFRSVH
eukprot:7339889-Prymnesium_polylepis.1